MRYFTEIVGCLNEKKWDISKKAIHKEKTPCRTSLPFLGV